MKKRQRRRKTTSLPSLPRLRKGCIGSMEEYRNNVAEFSRMVRNKKRQGTLTEAERMKEILQLNGMLSTLYDMQDKIEKKIVRKEGDEDQEEEEPVTIKKGVVTVTVPKLPEEHEDPESLAHSEEFGKLLDGAPVPLVEKKKEPEPVPEVHPALKEIFHDST
jgi:hypothetical protein